MTSTVPASMGEPLSEADPDGPYCECSAMRAIVDYHLKPISAERDELRARVGVLEGQLATAKAEVVIRDGAIVGRDKAIDSLEAWHRNWKPLVDAHMKRCNGCDACDSEGGDDA